MFVSENVKSGQKWTLVDKSGQKFKVSDVSFCRTVDIYKLANE